MIAVSESESNSRLPAGDVLNEGRESFRGYAKYKDSGVAWLGVVPTHWDIKPLRRLVTKSNAGEVIDRSFWGGDLELLYTCALNPLQSDYSEFPNEKRTLENDLLLTRNGTPYVHKPVLGSIYTNVVQRISLLPDIDRNYAAICLQNSALNLKGYGVSIESLNYEMWKELLVAIPPIAEQSTVVAFLERETGKIDALIAEQEKLIALLAEKRQATISHAVTRGLNPNAPMKDSGVAWLGEVPAHWRLQPLKHLANFQSGGTPSKQNPAFWDGDRPWASAKDLKAERLSDTIDHVTDFAFASGAAQMIPSGATLVVVRGMILARIFPVTQITEAMAINQDLKAVTTKGTLLEDFLPWLLRGTADESLRRLDEAGHGTKALRMEAWSSMLLPVPPSDEQFELTRFIEDRVELSDRLADEAEHVINLLRERRSALIAAAVTGQIDVRQVASRRQAPIPSLIAPPIV